MLRRALLAAVLVAAPASAKPANDSVMVQDEGESLAANRADVSPQADAVSASYKNALLFRDARQRLYDQGIDLHLIYTTETSSGLTEGARGTRYTGQIEFGGKFDLDKLTGLKGATVNIVLVNREGRDLSTDKIHNLFRVQEVFGANKDLYGADGAQSTAKVHQPHFQGSSFNILNGGIERWFEAVEGAAAENPFTIGLLKLFKIWLISGNRQVNGAYDAGLGASAQFSYHWDAHG